MKKSLITSIILFALLASSCASRRPQSRTLQPLAENPLLVARYLNVDTAKFQELDSVRNIRVFVTLPRELLLEVRHPDNQSRHRINDVEQAIQWLERYSTTLISGRYKLSHYKQVEDGFLLKGVLNTQSELHHHYCLQPIRWVILLIGYDHQITEIKRWEIDPCIKPTFHTDVTVHFPEFENADVRFPELIDGTIYHHLMGNLRFPPIVVEQYSRGGVVKVSFTVEIDGSMSNIEIIQDAGIFLLGREVLRCLMMIDGREVQPQGVIARVFPNHPLAQRGENQWLQWIPGMKNGEKTPMQVMVEVDFRIDLGDFPSLNLRRIGLAPTTRRINEQEILYRINNEPIVRPNRITRIVQRLFPPGRN